MTWKLDPSHSFVEFSAKHLMITTVRGRFNRYEVELDLDAEHPERSSIEAVLEVDSLTTGNADRDAHLHSADFFDVERYPTMTFRSTAVETVGKDRYRLVGDLTIKDVTRPVVLEVTSEGRARDPWGNQRWALSAQTTLNRKDFGLTWNVALESGGWLVGDDIRLGIELQAIEQAEQPATRAA